MNKKELLEAGITTDPNLGTEEKETSVTFPNDLDTGLFHSDVPTTIKWFLSIKESEVVDYRTHEGEIVSVTGRIPKSVVKLQGKARQSNAHSDMVSYGPNK